MRGVPAKEITHPIARTARIDYAEVLNLHITTGTPTYACGYHAAPTIINARLSASQLNIDFLLVC